MKTWLYELWPLLPSQLPGDYDSFFPIKMGMFLRELSFICLCAQGLVFG
jgi:hypothetical protein